MSRVVLQRQVEILTGLAMRAVKASKTFMLPKLGALRCLAGTAPSTPQETHHSIWQDLGSRTSELRDILDQRGFYRVFAAHEPKLNPRPVEVDADFFTEYIAGRLVVVGLTVGRKPSWTVVFVELGTDNERRGYVQATDVTCEQFGQVTQLLEKLPGLTPQFLGQAIVLGYAAIEQNHLRLARVASELSGDAGNSLTEMSTCQGKALVLPNGEQPPGRSNGM